MVGEGMTPEQLQELGLVEQYEVEGQSHWRATKSGIDHAASGGEHTADIVAVIL